MFRNIPYFKSYSQVKISRAQRDIDAVHWSTREVFNFDKPATIDDL